MGYNFNGQIGDGTQNSRATPFLVASGVRSVVAGWFFTLFLKYDGTLWGMGDNDYGQLGDGTITKRLSPVLVASNVRTISAGAVQSFYVKIDGSLWAMGDNGEGELGIGTTQSPMLLPVQVTNRVESVAAGHNHTLFIRDDNTLWSTGRNDEGQLGIGTVQDSPVPVMVATNVTSAAAGEFHSLYLKGDGTAWAFGGNDYGQLGDDTILQRTTPVQVGTDVVAVNAGRSYSFLLRAGAVISTQPRAQSASFGEQVSFSVTVTNAITVPTFQWFKDGVKLTGATNSTLSIPNASVADIGQYRASVTTAGGTLTTASVPLAIPSAFTETGNHYLRMQDETEYLRVDDANDFNLTNEGSILLWFQADPVQPVIPGAGLHAIVAKYEGHSPNPFEIRFSDERATEKRRIYVHLWDMTNNPFLWSPPNIDTNFHHVAYVKKGKTHLLYLDGLLVDYDSFDLGNLANDHPMYIGRNGAGRAFNGAVDDVQFWSRAVSQAEILHLMHNDPNLDDPSLIAYYDFDSQNGVDRSTYGNHGVVTAPIIPAPTPVLSPAHAFGIGVGNFFPTARYRLQSRNSLGATSPWMDVTNAVRADGHLFDVVGATTNRYYRIVTP
jgi:hypothetical protein